MSGPGANPSCFRPIRSGTRPFPDSAACAPCGPSHISLRPRRGHMTSTNPSAPSTRRCAPHRPLHSALPPQKNTTKALTAQSRLAQHITQLRGRNEERPLFGQKRGASGAPRALWARQSAEDEIDGVKNFQNMMRTPDPFRQFAGPRRAAHARASPGTRLDLRREASQSRPACAGMVSEGPSPAYVARRLTLAGAQTAPRLAQTPRKRVTRASFSSVVYTPRQLRSRPRELPTYLPHRRSASPSAAPMPARCHPGAFPATDGYTAHTA